MTEKEGKGKHRAKEKGKGKGNHMEKWVKKVEDCNCVRLLEQQQSNNLTKN